MRVDAQVLAWLAVAAYALHIMEERILDWHSSMKKSMKLSMDLDSYHVIGRVFLVLGAIAAFLVAQAPDLARAFAVFLLLNAVVFHIWPMISTQKFSPGSWTAVLFLVIAYLTWANANIPAQGWILPIAIGVAITVFPILLLQGAGGKRR